jgi:hypothetical protein
VPPCLATNKNPDSTLRLSIAIPVTDISGTFGGKNGNGKPSKIACRETEWFGEDIKAPGC